MNGKVKAIIMTKYIAVFTVQWSVWVRKFHKYVRDSYKIGIFYNIIISLITVDKGKKSKGITPI